jgi:hypothetical protein
MITTSQGLERARLIQERQVMIVGPHKRLESMMAKMIPARDDRQARQRSRLVPEQHK